MKSKLTAILAILVVALTFTACTPNEMAAYRAVFEHTQVSSHHDHPTLVCNRTPESGKDGNYQAVSKSGKYRGAYQWQQSTFNNHAAGSGYGQYVGHDPISVPPYVQDEIAFWAMHKGHNPGAWQHGCTSI